MTQETSKPPAWFWIVAAVALVWNLLGVSAFVMQVSMSPETLAALPEAERALYESFPLWALIAFAAAVFGGAVGSVLLLMKNKLAQTAFVISVVGVVLQMIYNLFIGKTMDVYGPGSIAMPIMILLFAGFLVWLSRTATAKGWIA